MKNKRTQVNLEGNDFEENTSKEKKRPEGESISFAVETVTPDLAVEYLRKSEIREADKSRKTLGSYGEGLISEKAVVQSYAKMMSSGAWVLNGMPIIFSRTGALLDGVARLEACILSETPFRTIVARNVSEDTLHTIDQHRRRTYSGVLESRGIRFAGAIQAALTKLIRIENGILGIDNSKISWSRFDSVIEANPEIIEAVAISEGTRKIVLQSTPRPILCFMAIKAGKRDKLRLFLGGLSDIESFPIGSPVRMLANQLRSELRRIQISKDEGGDYVPMTHDQTLAMSIMAFNDFCAGKTVSNEYFWTPDFGKETDKTPPKNLKFPSMKGYPGLKGAKFNSLSASAKEGEIAESLKRANKMEAGQESVEMKLITPQMAQKYLALNRDNRPLSDAYRNKIAQDIRAGNWMLNAQPICFTGDPDDPAALEEGVRLLNGQHRLHGCIDANMSIEVPIAKFIPNATFSTFDSQKKKLRLSGNVEGDPRVIVAAAQFQWREDQGMSPLSSGVSPTASEIKDTILRHPGLQDAYKESRTMREIASEGVMTFVIYKVRSENKRVSERFLNGLVSGVGLEVDNPVLAVRTRLIGLRLIDSRSKGRISRKDTLSSLLQAWSDFKAYSKKKQ